MIVSFAWTTPQFLDGSKDVTRRMWADEYAARFKPGSVHDAADKDLRYGGKRIGKFRVVSICKEPLRRLLEDEAYGRDECRREGFPEKTPQQFVDGFAEKYGSAPSDLSPWRLEFERVA